MAKDFTAIPYSGYGSQGLQVFTPTRIESVSAGGSIDTTKITCIRIPADNDYQINGVGTTATMLAGCTGIADNVNSVKFVDAVNVEVM